MLDHLETKIALSLLRDVADIAEPLLEGGHSTIAGRIAGGLRAVGRADEANQLIRAMRVGHTVQSAPVFIRNSRHVPPPSAAVRDVMPVLFDLLEHEPEACVRATLGHFFFVYTHPYMDGNGRIGRFLLNAMLSSGGYPWTITPVERGAEYMASLEEASVGDSIEPFARFIAACMQH